jgi:hypothetical protein
MTGQDPRLSAKLTFPTELNWVNFPQGFPFREWQDVGHWAGSMALMVHYEGSGRREGAVPDQQWFDHTRAIIGSAYENLSTEGVRYRFLLFHDLAVVPTPISVRTFLADLPWDEVRPMYAGELEEPGRAEGPTVESFDLEGAEAAVRSLRYHYLDPGTRSLVALYDYAFRRDGLDVCVRAEFIDLTAIRRARPVLDAFVAGIGITSGAVRPA